MNNPSDWRRDTITAIGRTYENTIIRERPLLAELQELTTGLLQDLLFGTVQVKVDGPKEGITHA